MKISANEADASLDLIERARVLYRDLSVGLQERIADLTTAHDRDPDCKGHAEAVKAHHRALQIVLDLEASLEKRNGRWNSGASFELDLDSARAEVLARVAVWLDQK